MSEIQTIELAARAAEEPKGQPTTGRFLFSSWHLVLIPIAVVMVIPLVWMLVTSLQTLDETRHYPPTIVPTSLEFRNYTDVLQQAPFARWFVNTLLVTIACVDHRCMKSPRVKTVARVSGSEAIVLAVGLMRGTGAGAERKGRARAHSLLERACQR